MIALALSDAQLRAVIAAASRLSVEQRGAFLESVAARGSGGGRDAYGDGAIGYHFKHRPPSPPGHSRLRQQKKPRLK